MIICIYSKLKITENNTRCCQRPAKGRADFWVGSVVALPFCVISYTARLHVLHRLDPEDICHKLAK